MSKINWSKINWSAIFFFFILPAFAIAVIALHTSLERAQFGDGICHACGVGTYELFDIEHVRNNGDLYYYRCNECGDLQRYESYQKVTK